MQLPFFEHFDYPVTFAIDAVALKSKFYALSKKYHPDFYLNESKEKQAEILHLSTLTNKAFQTLSDADKLMEYILKAKNIIRENENNALSPDFLMEMMELNEVMMELEFDFDEKKFEQISQKVNQFEIDIKLNISNLTQGFELKEEEAQIEILEKLKEFYFRMKYLLRIKESIAKFASR